MAAAGVLPLVMRRRTTVDPELVRLSDAMTVIPRRATAACSRSTVSAICTTTSSGIRRVSVGGGISTILRSRPGRICRPPAAFVGGCGGGCGGVLMAPWTLLTTGGGAERGELHHAGKILNDLGLLRRKRSQKLGRE